MSESQVRVTTTIDAPPAVVFDLLASPYRHHEFDGSGMVGDDEDGEPIVKAGQVFRMNMTIVRDGVEQRYQTDNLVSKFKPNRKIAWKPGSVDEPPAGWSWRYDLSPKGKRDHKTLVTLTFDWTDCDERTVERVGLPMFSEADLERSLELLAKAVKR